MSDNYLDNISNESLKVLQHFGPEAPRDLNEYACRVEDALREQLQQNEVLQKHIKQLQELLVKWELELSFQR